MRVVLDTNVLVSATLSDGPPSKILEHVEVGEIESVTSPGIVDETQDVLNRDKIPFSEKQTESFIEKFLSVSGVVSPEVSLDVVEDDPDDDKILECAVAADADYIVSGDSHLQEMNRFREIPILSPEEFTRQIE